MVPEMFSTLPWPKGCSASAGMLEVRTENRAMPAATRSTPEWIASDRMETEPIRRPTTSFNATRMVLEITDSRATLILRLCISIFRPFRFITACGFPLRWRRIPREGMRSIPL